MSAAVSLVQNTKFEELCRLCGSKTDVLAVHIFENAGTFSELCKKIYNCLQLEIHQQDALPKHLCDNCLVKLEMFWDFKDRSVRTEQLLIELYKQMKSNGNVQQCIASFDSNGVLMEISAQEVSSNDLPTDIDIAQLQQRVPDNSDYSIVMHNNMHEPHLENLHMDNHNLTSQDVSNHSLHNGRDDIVVLSTSQNVDKLSESSLNIMQQQLLNEVQMNFHQELQMSIISHNTIYSNNLKPDNRHYPKEEYDKEHLDSIDYSNNKNGLGIDSAMSDNSLGVDSVHFDRMMSYSSDSHIDQIQPQDESDSNPNLITDTDVQEIRHSIEDDYLLDGNTIDDRESVVNLTPTSDSDNLSLSNNFFKHENQEYFYKNDSSRRDDLILRYKDDISLDSNGFKNEDSSSLDKALSPPDKLDGSNDPLAFDSTPQNVENRAEKEQPKPSAQKPGSKVCNVCGKTYKSNYKLSEHMTKHTGERPYKCQSCDKAFRSKIGLAQHEAKHTGQYEFSCPTCGKGFQCRSYLIVHQRVHSDLKPYHCTTCGLNFKTKQSLLDHTNRHLGVKPFSCSICNRGFITKGLCMAHEKTHAGVDNRKYSCKICQKKFVSKSYLQTHSRIHTGEKPFICEVCGKGFLTGVDLKIHLTMHTGEKSFVCEMCGKAFARRDALKCHRRIHTGERPYRCDICGCSFTQFTPMANHRRHHTGEKPHSCETCGKTFGLKSSMVSHQKRHHKSGSKQVDKIEQVKVEPKVEEQV